MADVVISVYCKSLGEKIFAIKLYAKMLPVSIPEPRYIPCP